MLKKTVIMLSVLMLFVGILLVQAQTKTIYHVETQYIDTLNMPWTKSVKDLESTLNEFYDKPDGTGDWKLECRDGLCQPFYLNGSTKHIIKTYYEFGSKNKLKSIRSEYDATGYTRLIKRIEKDFTSSAIVTRAYQFAHHIYDRDYRNANIKVEVKHNGINKPVKFSATYKTIKQKEGEKHVDEMAMAQADPIVIFRAPMHFFAAYCMLLNDSTN